MEQLDLVNENDEIIGQTTRAQIYGNTQLIYRSAAAAIINEKRCVLVTRRNQEVQFDKGNYQFLTEDHPSKGEDPFNAATRIVQEEIGIRVRLKFIKKLFTTDQNESKFTYYYFGEYFLDVLQLDLTELDKAQWVPLHEVRAFFESSGQLLSSAEQDILTVLLEYYG